MTLLFVVSEKSVCK